MVSSLSVDEKVALYSELIDMVKLKSKVVRTKTDYFTTQVLEFGIKEAIACVCDYIHHPDRIFLHNDTLKYIVTDMGLDILLGRYAEDGEGAVAPSGGTKKEIKIGNATIQYQADGTTPTGHTLNLDDFIKNYKDRLKEYRRII